MSPFDGLETCPSAPECSVQMFCSTDLEFELVGVSVLPFVEVDEVVCDPVLASGLHVPADPEGITGDVTDLDLPRNRQATAIPVARVSRLHPWST